MLKDEIKEKINCRKKKPKKDQSQIELNFKTHNSGHETRLLHKRQA